MIRSVMSGVVLMAVVVLGGCGGPEEEEEGIVLAKAGWLPPSGVTVEKSTERWLNDAKMVMSGGGMKLEGGMSTVSRGDFREEVVSLGVLRVTCVRDRQRNVIVVKGNRQLRPEVANALEGKPVLVERRGPIWEARLESGKTPTPAEQRALNAMAAEWTKNTDVKIYGTKPRRIGEKWEVDASGLPALASSGETLTGTMRIELVEVGNYGGYECAVLEGDLDVTGEIPGAEGAEPRQIRIKGRVKVQRSLKHFVDLRYELEGVMLMSGVQRVGNVDMTMEAEGEMIMRGQAAVYPTSGDGSDG